MFSLGVPGYIITKQPSKTNLVYHKSRKFHKITFILKIRTKIAPYYGKGNLGCSTVFVMKIVTITNLT